MREQTFTTTVEAVTVEGAAFTVTTFELETTAFCDICGTSESGAADDLQAVGWYLGRGDELCPNCNF